MINTDKIQFFATEMKKMGARSVIVAWITDEGEASLFGHSSIPDSSVLTHLMQLHTTERIKMDHQLEKHSGPPEGVKIGKTNSQPNP